MGKIILLNTPIGNLGDLTPRVLEALTKGEVFAVGGLVAGGRAAAAAGGLDGAVGLVARHLGGVGDHVHGGGAPLGGVSLEGRQDCRLTR